MKKLEAVNTINVNLTGTAIRANKDVNWLGYPKINLIALGFDKDGRYSVATILAGGDLLTLTGGDLDVLVCYKLTKDS